MENSEFLNYLNLRWSIQQTWISNEHHYLGYRPYPTRRTHVRRLSSVPFPTDGGRVGVTPRLLVSVVVSPCVYPLLVGYPGVCTLNLSFHPLLSTHKSRDLNRTTLCTSSQWFQSVGFSRTVMVRPSDHSLLGYFVY